MALFYGRHRYLLKVKEFRFLEAVLWAEDEGVCMSRLADACGIPPHRFQRDLLKPHLLQTEKTGVGPPGGGCPGELGRPVAHQATLTTLAVEALTGSAIVTSKHAATIAAEPHRQAIIPPSW